MYKKLLAVALVTASLTACTNNPRFDDGYQLGDAAGTAVDKTVKVLTLQQKYCTESDPVARKLLLKLIRSAMPEYPADGLCSDVLRVSE